MILGMMVIFLFASFVGSACLVSVGAVNGYVLLDYDEGRSANIAFDGLYLSRINSAIRDRRGTTGLTALVMKGTEAVKIILRGAKQVPSDDKSTRIFEKAGNFKLALADFKATK